MKRTQIYLDEEQDARLERSARISGVTKSQIIRDAIDFFFRRARGTTDFQEALEETSGALPDLVVPLRDEWDRGYG